MRLCADRGEFLFCDNETNVNRLFGFDDSGPFKDGFDAFVVEGDRGAVAAGGEGTNAAAAQPAGFPDLRNPAAGMA